MDFWFCRWCKNRKQSKTKAPSFHRTKEDSLDSDYVTAIHRSSLVGDHCATPRVAGDREEHRRLPFPNFWLQISGT
ncbi:hypothetical protein MRB53_030975 [Persea americana]|uniref:Uncharacterized protein n=1 Tax=Persea americana TaxID=3435 RepID=A0ACC2KMZ6_PERAE|nr:hypothetical protein MRB53_030975 [Persea americana]